MILCVILGCIQSPDQVIALQHAAGTVASAYANSTSNPVAEKQARIGGEKVKTRFQPLKT